MHLQFGSRDSGTMFKLRFVRFSPSIGSLCETWGFTLSINILFIFVYYKRFVLECPVYYFDNLSSIQIILKPPATARMTQLAECLCLYLADSLPCNIKLLTHILKRTCTPIIKTKAQAEHLFLTRGQC